MATSTVEVNGIKLAVQVEGPEDGRPVLLLHDIPVAAPDELNTLLLDFLA